MNDHEINVVEVHDVSMRFNLAKQKVDSLKEYMVKFLKKQLLFDEFYALRKISFSIKKGESFAIIGENGCGKSTLLKVISGIFAPTNGSVTVRGNIAPLIELGAGFDMDLTARENIFLNGAVLGYDTAFMEQHYQEIMDFAELWDFADVPVKNFSSGMVARLGFSIATVVVPDILIVDEILSVGDFMFQQKCERKMQDMIDQGATLIFVSHSTEQVKKLCKKAVWLKHGILQLCGDAEEVCDAYVRDMESGGKGLVHLEDLSVSEEDVQEQVEVFKNEKPKSQYKFLDLLRAIAISMIVWDHLGPFRFPEWRIAQFINNLFNRPLGIIQYFGAFGVALFFLISGFLTFHSTHKESRSVFAKKRFVKIYPPLLIAVALFFIVQSIVSLLKGSPTYWGQFTLHQWITNATLINYFLGEPDLVNGVTWYLFPTILFYMLCYIFYDLIRKRPKVSIILFEIIIASMAFLPKKITLIPILYYVFQSSWYIAFLVFGVLVYYVKNNKLQFHWFLAYSALNYYLLIKCMVQYNPQYYEDFPYAISFSYAFAIFIIAMLLEERIKKHPVTDFLSSNSYSIYLTHMMFGGLAAELVNNYVPAIGYTAIFLIIVLVSLSTAWVFHSFIEKPLTSGLNRILKANNNHTRG